MRGDRLILFRLSDDLLTKRYGEIITKDELLREVTALYPKHRLYKWQRAAERSPGYRNGAMYIIEYSDHVALWVAFGSTYKVVTLGYRV